MNSSSVPSSNENRQTKKKNTFKRVADTHVSYFGGIPYKSEIIPEFAQTNLIWYEQPAGLDSSLKKKTAPFYFVFFSVKYFPRFLEYGAAPGNKKRALVLQSRAAYQ